MVTAKDEVLHLSTRDPTPGRLCFQLLSDVHLEFDHTPAIEPVAPVLCLCGDIGYARNDNEGEKLKRFIRSMSERFEIILYLAGNHEYWGTSFQDGNQWLEENLEQAFANVYLMHRRIMYINKVCILGATLWTNIPVRKSHGTFNGISPSHRIFWQMSDFDHIAELQLNNHSWPKLDDAYKWEADKKYELEKHVNKALLCYQSWFEKDVDWLNNELDSANDRGDTVLVLTHHAPTGKGTVAPVDQECIGMTHNELSSNFTNPSLKLWAFGHTHWNCDQMVNTVRLVSNAVGYPDDADSRVRDCEGYQYYKPKQLLVVDANSECCFG
jgi:hypothetical protein